MMLILGYTLLGLCGLVFLGAAYSIGGKDGLIVAFLALLFCAALVAGILCIEFGLHS